MFQRGNTLKLSKEGLDWLSGGDKRHIARLATLRFEYRCPFRNAPECITVKRLGKSYYEHYHFSFFKPAKTSIISRILRRKLC